MSYRGEPVAEIRPLETRKQKLTQEERDRELERRGVLVGTDAKDPKGSVQGRRIHVPGALERDS